MGTATPGAFFERSDYTAHMLAMVSQRPDSVVAPVTIRATNVDFDSYGDDDPGSSKRVYYLEEITLL